MAKTQTIRCIRKNPRNDPYTAIERVGGTNPDGGRWSETQQCAVNAIDSGEWVLFVEIGTRRVKVITAESPYGNGRRHIKTEADGQGKNNLLSLPECP